jgi:hypothetical protein
MYKNVHTRVESKERRTFVPELTQEKLDVRAREAVHCRKAQRSIFGDHWAADLPVHTHDNCPSE